MGIKDLNKLFENCKREPRNKYYSTIIYDGLNVIFQVLCSELSQLKKSGLLIAEWNAINLNLPSQISTLISSATRTIINIIKPQFEANSVERIYFVIDPVESPSYKIETSYTYNHKYESLIGEELTRNIPIELNIKADEQESRKKSQNKDAKREQQSKNINTFSQLNEEQKKTLLAIFNQAYIFNNVSDLMKLASYVIKSVLSQLKDFEFYVVQAEDEADLVIKNIAFNECDEHEPILVVSADTDYNVLFSDMQNVDTTSLMNRSRIYNPYNCWREIFKNYLHLCDYEHIIRLAPLFGNDYTVKESIVNAINCNDALRLFNGEIKRLRNGSGSKKITKLAMEIKHGSVGNDNDDEFTLNDIDDVLYEYNEDYFIKYYLSNILYTNWDKYNRYELMKQPTEKELTETIENALFNIYVDCAKFTSTDEQHENEQSTVVTATAINEHNKLLSNISLNIIIWKPEYIFNNWFKFFNKLEIINLSTPQEFIDYFYENEYDKMNNYEAIIESTTDASDFV